MHILVLSYEFPPLGGGGGRVVEGLSRQLLDKGHSVELVTMAWPEAPAIAAEANLTLHPVRCLRLRPDRCSAFELALYLLPALWVTWRLIRQRRFDACHAHFILPDALVFYLLRQLGGPPFLITAHGSDVPGYNPDRFKLLHRLLAPLWRRVVLAAERVLCPSPTLERLIESRLPEARTTVVGNGFEPKRLAGASTRHRRILVLSRLQPRKGVQHVVEAFSRIETDHELHIAGDGPMLPAIRERAASDPRVVVHGWIDGEDPKLTELLETSSIFVLFSEAENFPVSLLEAMAAGLAIVTTSGTGCADVVGDTALLVEPGDTTGLVAALKRLIDEPKLVGQLGEAGRRRMVEHFDWKTIAERHIELYAEAAAEAADRGQDEPTEIAALPRVAGRASGSGVARDQQC